ncbi:MAG: class I adenylate-forming enzyme family protein, partial [Pseudomonadota bacterium]
MPRLDIDGVAVLPRLPDYVSKFAKSAPGSIAVVSDTERFTYAELDKAVARWARALLAAGVSKGARVAMLSTPRAEFWIAFLATARIGAVWVGLNPRYTTRECDYVVDDAEPSILISLAEYAGADYRDHIETLTQKRPSMRVVVFGGALPVGTPLEAFLAEGSSADDLALESATNAVATTDPCLIVYTSGSTGSPKGAVLTHYALTFGATLQTIHFDLDDPSLVVSFPINHVASVADTCATTLVKGGKIVFQPQFDPVASVKATASERCTMMGGVPTMFQMQLATREFDTADLSSVRLILWGGAAMPRDTIRQLRKLDARLVTAYGMTETATHVTYTAADADFDALSTTVGRPDPRCDFRIATANGELSSESNAGEIQLRADFLMSQYWRRESASRDARTP